jgi:hypothetical protein
MYYRSIEDKKRLKKLMRDTRGCTVSGVWKKDDGRLYQYWRGGSFNYFERVANKKIRRYRGGLSNGRYYKKVAIDVSACY